MIQARSILRYVLRSSRCLSSSSLGMLEYFIIPIDRELGIHQTTYLHILSVFDLFCFFSQVCKKITNMYVRFTQIDNVIIVSNCAIRSHPNGKEDDGSIRNHNQVRFRMMLLLCVWLCCSGFSIQLCSELYK